MIPDEFVGAVLAWGGPSLRDLPWRRTRDPWAVLVSEVMSQQTQVHRVIPKWERFMDRFPTPERCAAASLAEVLELWQGLGYPRRARDLHRSAQIIDGRGGVPDQLDDLLALPGVGDYTARAVMAFAFGADVAVVDTNVGRVLARVIGERLTPRRVREIADDLVPTGDGWLWNQALMDLGGTLCVARSPECQSCPARTWCVWNGSVDIDDPAVGSAGVSSRQSRFKGSRREARGRLLRALVSGELSLREAAAVMERSPAESAEIVDGLISDGLVVRTDGRLRLPGV
ncbi:MAG: A/G-specific adenine glycosylase [Actinomycetota bacterium]|nr:A/G-specific adenine glycosylase [Actinomycetota bacterium]MDA3029393.1 A/G-specific adenine glycosylase [Actinomycetota bacterium]